MLRQAGKLFAAAISRFMSVLYGVESGYSKSDEDVTIHDASLPEGNFVNQGEKPGWFTSAHLHRSKNFRAKSKLRVSSVRTALRRRSV